VGTPTTSSALRRWAGKHFGFEVVQSWRTITPLTRAPVPVSHNNLFFIGDAARVVEPFTGEGIFYALRSGELAAEAIVRILGGEDRQTVVREFARAHASMYRGRLWINQLARAAVLSPRSASHFINTGGLSRIAMKLLTRKIAAGL